MSCMKAKRRGITVGELSHVALDDPSIDINIDYNQCLLLAKGTCDSDPDHKVYNPR